MNRFVSHFLFIVLIALIQPFFACSQKNNKQIEGVYFSLNEALKEPEKVKVLNLSNQNITNFPTEILQLTNLQQLILKNNKIEKLPENIDRLTNLTFLNLSKNRIKSLPASLKNLSNLSSLMVSQNKIQSLSDDFFEIKSIEILNLASNPLWVDVDKFKNFRNLKYINLYNTRISTTECERLYNSLPNVKVKCRRGCDCNN